MELMYAQPTIEVQNWNPRCSISSRLVVFAGNYMRIHIIGSWWWLLEPTPGGLEA